MSDVLAVNTLRILAADIVQKANSGHPGAPMGMAPFAHMLWSRHLKYSPDNWKWSNRDRFVLSNGHACALLYSLLHLSGHKKFTMDQLKNFRQIGSMTPGHPENFIVDREGGIEVSTGPLGQGISNAVGLAIGEAHAAAVFNKPGFPIVDHYTYVFTGDGCLQEGVSSEAGSLAGHLGLGKLIVFYDDNHVTIDGDTTLSFTEDVVKRYEAYGWHTITVPHGDTDWAPIEAALAEAHAVTDRPTIIKIRTTIGVGSVNQGNAHKTHGAPLGADDIKQLKTKWGFDPAQSFVIPPEVQAVYSKAQDAGRAKEAEWNAMFAKYKAEYPELAAQYERRFVTGELPADWRKALPTFAPSDPAKATRQFSQTVINAIAKVVPELVGGSADLNPSTLSYMDCSKDFQKNSHEGRNIRFGVREHGMAAVCNGLAAYGGYIPYGATFLNFIGYALGAVRLSAISRFGVLYVMTHDSIGLGEDGPTHQPIETLPMIRAMPNINLIRPADGNETSGAYAAALESRKTPSVLALSRQPVPNLKGTSIDAVTKGAYVLSDPEDGSRPQIIIAGSGTETHLAVAAAAELKDVKVRVVSFPCWEFFAKQSRDYQKSVFPDGVPVLAVEAASTFGWREYAHAIIGMHGFGASGPLQKVLDNFGFTKDNVVTRARQTLAFYADHPVPVLLDRPFYDSYPPNVIEHH